MVKEELIRHIKTTKKFTRTFGDYTDYFILIFPIGFIGVGLSMIYNYFKFDSELAVFLVSVILIILGILFLLFTCRRLNENISFEAISRNSNVDIESIADILNENFKLKDIDVDLTQGTVVAFTKLTAFSWGEQLTIVLSGDTILINSRPSSTKQPVTIIKDRRNIKKLMQIL